MLCLFRLSYRTWIFCSAFLSFCCSLCFSVWEVSIEISSSSESFLSCIQSTNNPIRGIFHFCYNVLISSISFWFFLRISMSLLTLPICSCMLIIVLNSQSENSNIPTMSGFDACSVSSNCVFLPFGNTL